MVGRWSRQGQDVVLGPYAHLQAMVGEIPAIQKFLFFVGVQDATDVGPLAFEVDQKGTL